MGLTRAPRYVVHVDRLVLEGVAPEDRARVAEAIREDLERRFAAEGLPDAWAEGARRLHAERAPGPPQAGASTPERLGASVARAAYGGEAP